MFSIRASLISHAWAVLKVQHQVGKPERESHKRSTSCRRRTFRGRLLRFDKCVRIRRVSGGRYRSPRQPSGACCGRTARKTIPPSAWTNGSVPTAQRKMSIHQELQDDDAARSDQRETFTARCVEFLVRVSFRSSWIERIRCPRLRPKAQAVGVRTGRTFTRARRVLSARRAPDSLWPHLAD